MEIGVVFPQTDFGQDPLAARDFAQAAESLGYSYVVAYDHVLGADPNRPEGWTGPYTFRDPFLEPLVLFTHMAAHTQTLVFETGILILPQRQTALVAKQAATLDVLSAGRLRIGVGLGWNSVEYAALGEDFHNRGQRIEEQVAVLRELWTRPVVDFRGKWHTIEGAGLNPLPVQRPIPIWFGGYAEPALRRAARIGDGWMGSRRTSEDSRGTLESLERFLQEEGRTRASFGVEVHLSYGDANPAEWSATLEQWQALGATHVSMNTMGAGAKTPHEHIAALRKFAEEKPAGLRASR
ncbi:MAG: LLM class F420-dependent oxidoreductase [Anaerolineales bacterium]|jgi:probable F420-dependent oxidoreductase